MGPDEKDVKNFVMCPINPNGSFGEPVELEKLKIVELGGLELGADSPDNSMYKNSCKFLSDSISVTLKCNMQRKMSRKKFKKWLMHYWWCDRNYAEQWCYLIGIFNGRVSYTKTYFDSFLSNPKLSLIFSIDKQLKETEK